MTSSLWTFQPTFVLGRKTHADGDQQFPGTSASKLRELALLLTAEVVDAQLETLRSMHGIEPVFGAHQRFAPPNAHSNAPAMIESGERNKERFQVSRTLCTCASLAGREEREPRFESISMRRKKPAPPPGAGKRRSDIRDCRMMHVRNASRRSSFGHSAHNTGAIAISVIRCSASFAQRKVSTSDFSLIRPT